MQKQQQQISKRSQIYSHFMQHDILGLYLATHHERYYETGSDVI